MFLHAQIVEFPAPSAYSLAWLFAVFFALLAMAVWLESRRRRALHRAGLRGQWAAVERLMDERRLNAAEAKTVRRLLKRHAADAPLEAVTSRLSFEALVDAAMRDAAKRADEVELKTYGESLRDIRVQLGLEATAVAQQIHSTRELDGGQRVEIAPEGSESWVRLFVDDVDEAYFYLRYRDAPPVPALPGAGERVKCALWRDDDGRYFFETKVVAAETTPPRLTLAHAARLNRTQHREHFRVRHDQTTTAGILGPSRGGTLEDLPLRAPATKLRGRITSLSGGGCAFVVQEALSDGVLVRLRLELEEEPPLEVHAETVSTQPISGGRYLVRARFVALPEESADAIARHVMRHQQQKLAERQSRDSA